MKNTNINLSVLMAVYNAEKKLEECMESLLCQSVEKMEIIVVDDGSTDGSMQIVEKYKEKFEHIKIISKEHGGTLLTRLEGMRHAKGEYIAFIDCDDTFQPYSLHNILNIAMEKKVDILEFGYRLFNAKKREIYNQHTGHKKKPEEVLVEGERKCFDLLQLYELDVQLFLRFYSKRLCKRVLNYFMGFADYKIRFRDRQTEDEFITPLFFANAKSYYCVKQKIYNYTYLNQGSTTHSISVNTDSMLKAVEDYMSAHMYIARELKRKRLINDLEYIDYNLEAIEYFLFKCKMCNMPQIDRVRKILQYYAVHDILFMYIGRKASRGRV